MPLQEFSVGYKEKRLKKGQPFKVLMEDKMVCSSPTASLAIFDLEAFERVFDDHLI